jgi:hypothetical protein
MIVLDDAGCLRLSDNLGAAGPWLIFPSDTRLDSSEPTRPRLLGGVAGDTLDIEHRGFIVARGVRVDTRSFEPRELNRVVPPACAGPAFSISTWEEARGHADRKAGRP